MLVAFVIYLCVGYLNQLYSINMTAPLSKEPLYDVGFKYIPALDPKLCNYALLSLIVYFIGRWIFVDRMKISNYITMMIILFVIRICCFGLTTVPYPMSECNARRENDPIIWNVMPYLWDNHMYSCYDLMFSGHASHATLVWMFTIVYTKNQFEIGLVSMLTILCNLLIIAGRIHYTHDVIIGSTFAVLMFGAFFSMKLCPHFRKI
jgi:hypothetical protein